mgnify:CR=1 FL=1
MNEFSVYKVSKEWQYNPIIVSDFPAHERETNFRSQLTRCNVDDRIFAHFNRKEKSIHWSSEFENLVPYETLSNKNEILKKFYRDRDKILKKCPPSGDFYSWFEKIFSNVTIYSNGKDYCLIWGIVLRENEKIIIPPPVKISSVAEPIIPIPNDSDNIVLGCTDPKALNYNADANKDDGSCTYEVVTPPPPQVQDSYPWWWLLLLILTGFLFLIGIILSLLYCLAFCWNCPENSALKNFNPVHGAVVENPRPDILPEDPNVIPPYDDNDIELDSLFGGFVMTDVFNIADMSDNDFANFVDDVEIICPSSQFEYRYWDSNEDSKRLQLKIIDETITFDSLKISLKERLERYNPLVWKESLFATASNQSNDLVWSEEIDELPIVDYCKQNNLLLDNQASHLYEIGFDQIFDQYKGSSNIKLAIIDDGFDLNHEDFSSNYKNEYNVLSRNKNVNSSNNRNHGSHVSGLACANANNNIGTIGVASECTLMPIQIQNDNSKFLSSSSIIDAILYAYNNDADVINLSLGLPFGEILHHHGIINCGMDCEKSDFESQHVVEALNEYQNSTIDQSLFWSSIYEKLEQKNIMIIYAAGNDPLPLEIEANHKSRFPIYVSASSPGHQSMEEWTAYPASKIDSLTCVAAPGYCVLSTVPDNNYIRMPGTSMAAPIVAASVALVKSNYPDISNDEIREAFKNSNFNSNDKVSYLWLPAIFDYLNLNHSTS